MLWALDGFVVCMCWIFGKIDEKDGSTLSYTGSLLHLLTVGLVTGEVVALEAITVQVVGLANAAVVEEVVVFVVVDKMVRFVLVCGGVVCNVDWDGGNAFAIVVVLELGWLVWLIMLSSLGWLVFDRFSTTVPPPSFPCTSNKCG